MMFARKAMGITVAIAVPLVLVVWSFSTDRPADAIQILGIGSTIVAAGLLASAFTFNRARIQGRDGGPYLIGMSFVISILLLMQGIYAVAAAAVLTAAAFAVMSIRSRSMNRQA